MVILEKSWETWKSREKLKRTLDTVFFYPFRLLIYFICNACYHFYGAFLPSFRRWIISCAHCKKLNLLKIKILKTEAANVSARLFHWQQEKRSCSMSWLFHISCFQKIILPLPDGGRPKKNVCLWLLDCPC